MTTEVQSRFLDAAKDGAREKAAETGKAFCVLNFGSAREKPRYSVMPLEKARQNANGKLPEYLVFTAEPGEGVSDDHRSE